METDITDPSFPDECPSCGCTEVYGTRTIGAELDTMSGAIELKQDKVEDTWLSAWCDDCGKMFIEDEEWVIDPTDGSPQLADDESHHTFDEWARGD